MPGCSVKTCQNWNGNTKHKRIKYFRIPDDDRQDAWIQFCEKEKLNLKHARVCSVHFRPEYLVKTGEHLMILGEQPKWKLTATAIPTERPVIINTSRTKKRKVLANVQSVSAKTAVTTKQEYNIFNVENDRIIRANVAETVSQVAVLASGGNELAPFEFVDPATTIENTNPESESKKFKSDYDNLINSTTIKVEKEESEFINLQQTYYDSQNNSDDLLLEQIKEEIKIEYPDNNILIQDFGDFAGDIKTENSEFAVDIKKESSEFADDIREENCDFARDIKQENCDFAGAGKPEKCDLFGNIKEQLCNFTDDIKLEHCDLLGNIKEEMCDFTKDIKQF